jgi:hypothetical protein
MLADSTLRVIVELVGEAAAPRAEQMALRLSDDLRRNVQLIG